MNYTNLIMDVFCVILCMIMLFIVRMSECGKERLSRIFMWTILGNILMLMADIAIGTIYVLGAASYSTSRSLLWIMCSIIAACGPVLLALLTAYVVCFVSIKTELSKIAIYAAYVAVATSVADIACIIATQFNHMYFMLDQNNLLVRQDWFMLSQSFSFICMAINMGIIIAYRKVMNRQELLAFISYITLPTAAVVVHILVEGFSIIYFATTLSVFILFACIQNELSQKIKQKELELTKSQIAIMLSQIQPHFLYNALTAIARLCDTDPKKAKASTVDFSEYLRGNMDSIGDENLISFEKEMGHVKSYLRLEQAIYEKCLVVKYDIKADGFLLPPLTIQPIVENAVKHGIGKRVGGGTVKVSTDQTEDDYVITISDDGMGFGTGRPLTDGDTHIGIENVRQRLKQQRSGTLEIVSVPGSGTTATIKIPKRLIMNDGQ